MIRTKMHGSASLATARGELPTLIFGTVWLAAKARYFSACPVDDLSCDK
jgi:hypothetical protein